MVFHIVGRVARASAVRLVGVATTTEPSDDPLVEACEDASVPVYRGPVNDLVGRLLGAASAFGADALVRVWGDAPFIDSVVVDAAIDMLFAEGLEFVTSGLMGDRTYPEGMDVEVYTRRLLERMDAESAHDLQAREYPVEIVKHLGAQIGNLRYGADLSDLHFTVDYPEDLNAARSLHNLLTEKDPNYTFESLCSAIRGQPKLVRILSKGARNADYLAFREARADY